MTRIIATVGTVAALLFAPALPLVASAPHLDLDLSGITDPVVDTVGGLVGGDTTQAPTTDPAPVPDPAPAPDPAPSQNPVVSTPVITTPVVTVPSVPVVTTPVTSGGATSGATSGGATSSGGTVSAGTTAGSPTRSMTMSTHQSGGTTSSGMTTLAATSATAAPAPLLSPVSGETLKFTPSPVTPQSDVRDIIPSTGMTVPDGGIALLLIVAALTGGVIASRAIWLRFVRA